MSPLINTCVKTGCHVYLHHMGLYAYGDAFCYGSSYLFRFVHIGEEAAPVKHFTLEDHVDRFDRDTRVETWVALSGQVIDHGYEGVPL